ncbi:hypothetical protein N865_14020 [Intrasporangium oryzae NRRL B-24470]|uniref:Uncharacterized protein n=1 Tax=Intrasporangium oryzae NRRL B-24470 TaxID=1386089 RepID=W9G3E7_9MICO|nr:hypothetical protein [Intrasporangium oryzae]EWT00641.1 hypothetical protein N865_14020 [Intrasporangium oryzae NRRL B-24470]
MSTATVPSGRSRTGRRGATWAPDSHDFPTRRYDLVKEFVIALGVMTLLAVIAAIVFSSPDDPAITLQEWAKQAPNDVVATAAGELAGTTTSAGYGPPFNTNGDGQVLGPLSLQKLPGVTLPIDSAKDFVIDPLSTVTGDPTVAAAVKAWNGASADQQAKWANAYADALSKAPDGDPAKVASGDYGPVPDLAQAEVRLAASGALEGLLTSRTSFFGVDSTKALMLLADGSYLEDQARAQNLGGDQWGIMNETGNYPGQPWLWLYSFWYQVPPFSTSDNADIQVWAIMVLLSIGFICIPWIPGLRTLPKHLGVHKLIWRNYRR